jgi:rod shape-determining protein MreD
MIKKYGFIFLLSVILCILQQAIFSRIIILNYSFDVVFVFLICFALLMDDIDSVIFALICGLLRDSFFPYIFGLNTILFILSAYIITHINKRIYKNTILIPIMISFGFTLFKGLLYYSYLYISSIKFDFLSTVTKTVLYESILNAIVSIIIFGVVRKIVNIRIMQQEWKF